VIGKRAVVEPHASRLEQLVNQLDVLKDVWCGVDEKTRNEPVPLQRIDVSATSTLDPEAVTGQQAIINNIQTCP
jgi:hypothetical protein